MAGVLVSGYGSYGDIAPLLAIAEVVHETGGAVTLACPRSVAPQLPPSPVPVVASGGAEALLAMRDHELLTTGDGGWASWRLLLERHVAADLEASTALHRALIDDLDPAVVVTSTLAVGARMAAMAAGRPVVTTNMYEQWLARPPGAGPGLEDAVARAWPGSSATDEAVAQAAWGVGGRRIDLLDDALARPGAPEATRVGLPGTLDRPAAPLPPDLVAWMATRRRPIATVTLGSFLGRLCPDLLRDGIGALRGAGLAVVVAGLLPGAVQRAFASDDDVVVTGFVSLLALAERSDVVLHHAGIGTSHTVLRAGAPALLAPLGFDQAANTADLERLGVGLAVGGVPTTDDVDRLLADPSARTASGRVGEALVPPDVAARRAASVIDGAHIAVPSTP